MRLVFAGTPEFAATALQAIHAAGFDLALVLTQPDRPAGRGLKLQASPVKQWALDHGLPVLQPRSLRLDGKFPEDAQAAREALEAAQADAMIVAAYGLILPAWVLEQPPHGCLNIHGSLLPRWRGAAPIHRAIEAGDVETGITIMQMDVGLDTGPMLLAEREPIHASDTTATLHDRLAALGGRLIVEALRQIDAVERTAADGVAPAADGVAPAADGVAPAADGVAPAGLQSQPQPTEGVTYAHKIDKAEARIDWTSPAALIERRVRAFDPFPGASFESDGVSVKLWRAAVVEGQGAPGTLLAAPPGRCIVACGEGALELLELQRPGGRRAPAAAFLQGHALAVGSVLG